MYLQSVHPKMYAKQVQVDKELGEYVSNKIEIFLISIHHPLN